MTSDRVRLEKFIRGLFVNVLDIPNPQDSWIESWVEHALRVGDPLAVFQHFVDGKTNTDRVAWRADIDTRWQAGHFYSPVVSRSELEADWPRLSAPAPLHAIDLRSSDQERLFAKLSIYFPSIPFPETKSSGFRYYYGNPSYNFGDALIYWSMLRTLKPRRIIEVGSGFSSALALDTIDLTSMETDCIFIDPHPAVAEEATAPLAPRHKILPQRVQDVDLRIFESLQKNDLFFVDSSHIVKTGSDVCFELHQILPLLNPGVIVHFHDIFFPFEYPKEWAVKNNHSWNEIYILQSFMMYNSQFEILFFNHYIATQRRELVLNLNSETGGRFLINPGGGLWLRRV